MRRSRSWWRSRSQLLRSAGTSGLGRGASTTRGSTSGWSSLGGGGGATSTTICSGRSRCLSRSSSAGTQDTVLDSNAHLGAVDALEDRAVLGWDVGDESRDGRDGLRILDRGGLVLLDGGDEVRHGGGQIHERRGVLGVGGQRSGVRHDIVRELGELTRARTKV